MELALEAADGWQIHNDRDAVPIVAGGIALAKQSDPILFAAVKSLAPASSHYNCHGLTFGSRRTRIASVEFTVDTTSSVHDILSHDGYFATDSPVEGDVALYRSTDGEIDHTGIVCWIDPHLGTVYVWSMWGGLGEFRHPASLTPYKDCTVEYWRLKK